MHTTQCFTLFFIGSTRQPLVPTAKRESMVGVVGVLSVTIWKAMLCPPLA